MPVGRKPLPAPLKIIKGTNRKSRENPHAPKVESLDRIPPPPEYLDEIAAEKWVEVAQLLVQQKILTDMDLHNLEGFCFAYSTMRRAQVVLRSEGLVVTGAMGGPIKNPASTIIKEASADIRAFGGSLGLDPASRSRLIVGGGKKGKDNPFASF